MSLLVKNCNLITPLGNQPQKGTAQGQVVNLPNTAILIENKLITYVGLAENAPPAQREVNAGNRLVTPGLVDCHTHLVFGGDRSREFELKLSGVPYLDILKQGGGILSTVKATREASYNELYQKTYYVLDQMLAHGTTTLEAKSGYGLDLQTEIKQLKISGQLNREHPVTIVSTFMGAHAVPGKNYTREVIKMLDVVKEENLSEFCDIFCEEGVFTLEETREILTAAKAKGFKLKIHADEINALGGAALAGELNAISAEHLIETDSAGIHALAQGNVIAVALPATSFYLNKNYAKVREMINAGVAVAVASDFNPGSSPCYNLQIAMTLACLKYGLSPKEILTAVTLNAACAIDLGHETGTVQPGKYGDLVIWDCEDLDYLFYRFGNNEVYQVIKHGETYNVCYTAV